MPNQPLPYLFVIIALLVAVNFYLLFKRSKKSRHTRKESAAKHEETIRHHDNLVRKLDREQIEAARRVELRNKTLEMYEQVRKQAEAEEDSEVTSNK